MNRRNLSPQQKKQLAYDRDFYHRAGESQHAWRRSKPKKKAKANRAYRRGLAVALQKLNPDGEGEIAAVRRYTTWRKRKIEEWGLISLRQYAAEAREIRAQSHRKP